MKRTRTSGRGGGSGSGAHAADFCHVVYGGSVEAGQHSRELMALPDVDGALVGGASLDVRTFTDIVARSPQSTG